MVGSLNHKDSFLLTLIDSFTENENIDREIRTSFINKYIEIFENDLVLNEHLDKNVDNSGNITNW